MASLASAPHSRRRSGARSSSSTIDGTRMPRCFAGSGARHRRSGSSWRTSPTRFPRRSIPRSKIRLGPGTCSLSPVAPTKSLPPGGNRPALLEPGPSAALFTSQNLLTIGGIQSLRSAELERRVALIGFDDVALSDVLDPAISVVAQDTQAIGRSAAELLFRRLDGDASPSVHLVVP